MQTLLCSVIIIFALIYVLKRWLPTTLTQALAQLFGRQGLATTSDGCDDCSSCGNCGTASTDSQQTQSDKKIIVIHRK